MAYDALARILPVEFPRPPRLTPAQIGAFYRDGYLLVPQVFDETDISLISDAFERLADTASRFTGTTIHRGTQFVVRPAERGVCIDRIVWVGAAEPILSAYGRDDRLLALAARILGTPRMEQLINQAHYKLAGDGVEFPWHQDSVHRRYGTPMWTDVDGRGSFVEMVTAVDPMTADNGPLQLIPGSNAQGHIPVDPVTRKLPPEAVDEARAVTIEMAPGDVLLFGPYTIHGSRPNLSRSPRRAFLNGFSIPGANRRIYPGDGAGRTVVAPFD